MWLGNAFASLMGHAVASQGCCAHSPQQAVWAVSLPRCIDVVYIGFQVWLGNAFASYARCVYICFQVWLGNAFASLIDNAVASQGCCAHSPQQAVWAMSLPRVYRCCIHRFPSVARQCVCLLCSMCVHLFPSVARRCVCLFDGPCSCLTRVLRAFSTASCVGSAFASGVSMLYTSVSKCG